MTHQHCHPFCYFKKNKRASNGSRVQISWLPSSEILLCMASAQTVSQANSSCHLYPALTDFFCQHFPTPIYLFLLALATSKCSVGAIEVRISLHLANMEVLAFRLTSISV